MKINKSILLPIIALVALFLKQAFNFELSQEQMDIIVDGLLAVVALSGIFLHPKKETNDTE